MDPWKQLQGRLGLVRRPTLWLSQEGQGRAGALAGFMSASGVGSVGSRTQGLLLTRLWRMSRM